MNGLLLMGVSAQDTSDTTKTVSEADSTLEGVKFIYRPPKGPVSLSRTVSPGKLYYINLSKEQYETTWDSTDNYTISHKIDGIEIDIPQVFNFDQFVLEKKRQQELQIRKTLINDYKEQDQQGKGL
ncbi:MAG TPA: hypothetical protein DEG32_03695, partial [Balneolaceae bacterium]|nr:hypothetical protein [Balneolaceae bacterium]